MRRSKEQAPPSPFSLRTGNSPNSDWTVSATAKVSGIFSFNNWANRLTKMEYENRTYDLILIKPAQDWIWSLCSILLLDSKIQAVDDSSILTGSELDFPANVFLGLVPQCYVKPFTFKLSLQFSK